MINHFMKKYLVQSLIAILFLLTSSVYAASETYQVDPGHSYVLWHISHFDFSQPSGKWMISKGTLVIDKDKPQDSKVDVTIQVADIITGIPELDKHLKSQSFFDIAKFPTATFVSDKVSLSGKDKAKVHGILTVHGISKPVILDVKLNKIGISPITNKNTIGFTATTTLKRSDFGMTTLLPGLGDDVKIEIEMEATAESKV